MTLGTGKGEDSPTATDLTIGNLGRTAIGQGRRIDIQIGFVSDPPVPVLIVILLQRLPEAAMEHAREWLPVVASAQAGTIDGPHQTVVGGAIRVPSSPRPLVGQSRCERSNDANDLFATFYFSELWALGSCLFSQILSQKVKGGKRPFGSFAGSLALLKLLFHKDLRCERCFRKDRSQIVRKRQDRSQLGRLPACRGIFRGNRAAQQPLRTLYAGTNIVRRDYKIVRIAAGSFADRSQSVTEARGS